MTEAIMKIALRLVKQVDWLNTGKVIRITCGFVRSCRSLSKLYFC